MEMTLEELRDEWARHARRLDERLGRGMSLLREDWLASHRERVRRLGAFRGFDLAVWIATLALLGHFLASHWGQPMLFASALALQAWTLAAGVGQLLRRQALLDLDYGASVVALQARVEVLRIARIRAFNREFLTGQLVWWIPFFTVAFAGLTGVDLYAHPGFVSFAAWNLAAGVAAIPIAMGLARRYGERLARNSMVRHVADSIAGRDIAEARAFIETLRRFEAGGDCA
jgi:hypothetical protein